MKQELIVKSNEILIHPIYKTSMELKIFSKIILELRKNPEEDTFILNKKELLESFGCDKDSYGELKKVAERMFRPIDINKGKGNFILRTMFLEINADIEGQIMFEVSPKMKPYFLNLTKNFTQYYFENIARLKSGFSIRIYELLKQYENIGKITKSLVELRFFLNIDDGKFLKYNDFKKKVILVAQKELKEKTDIYFEFKEIKEVRKIVEIKFTIFENKKIEKTNDEKINYYNAENEKFTYSEEQQKLKEKLLKDCGIAEKIVDDLIATVKMEQIESNITYAENEYKKGSVKKNFSGYVLDAIKNNYANNVSLFELDNKQKEENAKTEKLKQEILAKKEDLKNKLSLEFSRAEKDRFINLLNDQEKENLKNEILKEMELEADIFSIDFVKKKGLNSPAAGSRIIKRIPNFEKRREQFIAEKLKEAGF